MLEILNICRIILDRLLKLVVFVYHVLTESIDRSIESINGILKKLIEILLYCRNVLTYACIFRGKCTDKIGKCLILVTKLFCKVINITFVCIDRILKNDVCSFKRIYSVNKCLKIIYLVCQRAELFRKIKNIFDIFFYRGINSIYCFIKCIKLALKVGYRTVKSVLCCVILCALFKCVKLILKIIYLSFKIGGIRCGNSYRKLKLACSRLIGICLCGLHLNSDNVVYRNA